MAQICNSEFYSRAVSQLKPMLQDLSAQAYDQRQIALQAFLHKGFSNPDKWRYSRILPDLLIEPQLLAANLNAALPAEIPQSPESMVVVICNGWLRRDLCRNLENAYFEQNAASSSEDFLTAVSDHAESLLNQALYPESLSLTLQASTELQKIIVVQFFDSESPGMAHPRFSLTLPENSQAEVLEYHLQIGQQACFANIKTEILLKAHARLKHSLWQDANMASCHFLQIAITQLDNASYHNSFFLKGALVQRVEVLIKLIGQEAKAQLHNLQFLKDVAHSECFYEIRHENIDTSSQTQSLAVVDHQAESAFTGKILVTKQAFRSKAHLQNKNLLISPTAKANSRPQLEIYQDEVECSHGATVGQLDEEALFYLNSRGIASLNAKNLLVQGFIRDIKTHMLSDHQAALESLLADPS